MWKNKISLIRDFFYVLLCKAIILDLIKNLFKWYNKKRVYEKDK